MSVDRRCMGGSLVYWELAAASVAYLFHGRWTSVIPRRNVCAGSVRLRYERQTSRGDGGLVGKAAQADVSTRFRLMDLYFPLRTCAREHL